MTRLRLFGVCIALAGAACAAAPTTGTTTTPADVGTSWSEARLRDTDGNPLPAYAIEDSGQPPVLIHCADGNAYQIAFDRPGRLYSPSNRTTEHAKSVGSEQTICNRILGYRLTHQ